MSAEPSVWRIVREAVAEAPAAIRRRALVAVAVWLVMMVVQALDSAGRSGPAAIAEFLSALCGSAGGVLLALSGMLNASAEQKAGQRRSGPEADACRRLLIALPAMGLAAGALLSAAMALTIMRAVLGVSIPFAVVLLSLFGAMFWLSAAIVTSAARTLYAHAQFELAEASRARVMASDAQLSALQSRMNPHFLFNALNTVAALIRTEPAAAERVTENLSGVLRTTLERSATRMSTLGEEIEYVRAWLAVEQERWKDRLRVEWDVPPGVEEAELPPLVLQPLIENALKHAIGARMAGGTIGVSARRTSDELSLRVADDGPGFPAARVERTGLGNLRERLDAIYGQAASVHVETPDRGAAVTVRVPIGGVRAGADR